MAASVLRSTALVSIMTFLSRILGFVRDMTLAQVFGAGPGTDAFFVAFRIPNLFRRLSAEGAFSLAFVPVLNEYKVQRPDELRELIDRVVGTFGALLFVITLIGVLSAPFLVYLFAPGFEPGTERYEMTVEMLRLTFPYVLFISLVAAAGGVLNSFGNFGVPAFTPVLLNVCLIGSAFVLAPLLDQPIMALAWGVLLAGIVQLAFQIPFLQRLGMLPRWRWGWAHEGVRRIMRLMVPALVGSSAAQINLLINTILASFLMTGSVSWLYYTDRLVEFPLAVFAVAISTVILPRLSREHSEASERFRETLDWGLRLVLIVGVPATVALIVLAQPLLTTFFHYGEFTANDVHMTARSLMAYSLGLLGFMLVKVLAPGFYARQDTRTPVRIGLVAIGANIVLNLLLVTSLAHVGLALAAALASYVNAVLLFSTLYRRGVYRPGTALGRLLAQIAIASAVMGVGLWWAAGETSDWLAHGVGWRVGRLSGLVAAGLFGYLALLGLFGVRYRQLVL